jgi:hypothetical protein
MCKTRILPARARAPETNVNWNLEDFNAFREIDSARERTTVKAAPRIVPISVSQLDASQGACSSQCFY